ncbi:MAG: hypothetical protein HY881_16475 [Deltaproteobacteria bacterium]|nr:hypothetical protein [Deltaproteobacteria bacterium]
MNRQTTIFNILAMLIINLAITCVATAGLQKADANTFPSGVSMSITINDWAEPSVFAQTDPISVAVNFNPGEYAGTPADWWMLAGTQSGQYYYLAESGMWVGPVPPSQVRPVLQSGLFPLTGQSVLKVPGLPPGIYQFYFGVDEMDGVINPDVVYTTTPLTIVATPNSFVTDTGTGTIRKEGALWIMNLKGNYYDMGRQYGYLAKDHLHAMFKILDNDIDFNKVQGILAQNEPTMDDRERLLLYGMSLESGLTFQQLRFMGLALLFSYSPPSQGIGCSVFGATRTQTTTGSTLIGRDFDNPSLTMDQLSGRSAVIVYNPVDEVHGNNHVDNQVSVVTTLGWVFGASTFNSRGLNFEYLNGMISIPSTDLTISDGLHQNLFAAFDCDTEDHVDARYLNAKVAVATLTQVSDAANIWHYERSPLENSMKLQAGQANGGNYYYANPTDMDIFTNHFFLVNHINQSFKYTSPTNDSESRSFQRLVNVQNLAQQVIGRVSVAALQQIMTTDFTNGGSYWDPFITGTADQNVYTCITDVKNKTLKIYPSCERERASWVELDLNKEFR